MLVTHHFHHPCCSCCTKLDPHIFLCSDITNDSSLSRTIETKKGMMSMTVEGSEEEGVRLKLEEEVEVVGVLSGRNREAWGLDLLWVGCTKLGVVFSLSSRGGLRW
jgi:hypothetical protein